MKQEDMDWYQFQEVICEHFRALGADAQTNVTVEGVRTNHDVDILVRTKFLGQDITWVVEAKFWNSKVNKSHVLALRAIVDDIGADRGFIVSKKGFQSGATEAAQSSNVNLKTFEELKSETKDMVEGEIIKMYSKRLYLLEDRYWSHSKSLRIKYGLREDVWDYSMNFSGQLILAAARKAIMAAEDFRYPIVIESHQKEQQGQPVVHNFQQLQNWLNLNLNYFEEKLIEAEWAMYQNDDYSPDLVRTPEGETTISSMLAQAMYRAESDG
ncbi:restriction endonuclease [Halomonas rhizosphaerae]|uniref:Restriction endonuclease n=1 Tax=Halomonas rhizosphaerae TaxID=3043296 RepID=A0ABT6UYP3_9GAMM|nr:restriction endonuclease [Halomonas rhizosphaerae]MDI5891098.1 restriction endonuclease [Halomonas rhizosphaerae]